MRQENRFAGPYLPREDQEFRQTGAKSGYHEPVTADDLASMTGRSISPKKTVTYLVFLS